MIRQALHAELREVLRQMYVIQADHHARMRHLRAMEHDRELVV
jgi:hypothetical protein